MKKGWEYKKLGEVTTFMSGYTPKKEEIKSFGTFPYFKVAEMNLIGNEKYMTNTPFFISSPLKIFPKGSIIFPKNGGAVYTEKKRILKVDSVIDLNTEAICSGKELYNYYLYYFLSSIKISSFDKGGGLPSLDMKKMAETMIGYPPFEEQRSIVDNLDSAFAKIDAMKANAEKALNEAKALFQASLKEMLEPKEGWEEKKFGEVCWYNKNNGLHKGTKYVGMEHIEQGTGKLLGTISSDDVLSNTFAFSKGDVLYGRLRPYLKKVIVADFDGCCSTEIFPIQSKNILASFLMYWFLTDEITNKVNATCAGCRMPRGNMNDVLKFDISYPSISEQHSIVTTLDSLKSKVDRLQENYEKISQECDALKQAILRQVFE